jgi:hypothetical protein
MEEDESSLKSVFVHTHIRKRRVVAVVVVAS